jgi:hypothetical protein
MAAGTKPAHTDLQPMNTRLCLTIAARIDAALQRELGEGIDLARMLADPLYRRDVLLVCEAQHTPELTALASEFHEASIAAEAEMAGDSGFSPSKFFNSLFGALGLPSEPPAPKAGDQERERSGSGRRGSK